MEVIRTTIGKLLTALVLPVMLFLGALVYAQDNSPDLKVDVDMTKSSTTEQWYTNPLYWVIGALLLIILVAVVARGSKRDH